MEEIGFSEAQTRVRLAVGPEWTDDDGELFVAPYVFEDATHWVIIYGAREALVDDDHDFDRLDPELTFVSKTTGAISHLPGLANRFRLRSMELVGDWPED